MSFGFCFCFFQDEDERYDQEEEDEDDDTEAEQDDRPQGELWTTSPLEGGGVEQFPPRGGAGGAGETLKEGLEKNYLFQVMMMMMLLPYRACIFFLADLVCVSYYFSFLQYVV